MPGRRDDRPASGCRRRDAELRAKLHAARLGAGAAAGDATGVAALSRAEFTEEGWAARAELDQGLAALLAPHLEAQLSAGGAAGAQAAGAGPMDVGSDHSAGAGAQATGADPPGAGSDRPPGEGPDDANADVSMGEGQQASADAAGLDGPDPPAAAAAALPAAAIVTEEDEWL